MTFNFPSLGSAAVPGEAISSFSRFSLPFSWLFLYLKGHFHGHFELFDVNSVPESLVVPLPIHKILLLNCEEDIA